MDYTQTELEPGINLLPQVYNPSIAVGRDPPVRVRASIAPEIGTSPTEARSPTAATVALAMEWEDALRLALGILSMAQKVGVALPEGVEIPDREWTDLTSSRPPDAKAGGWPKISGG